MTWGVVAERYRKGQTNGTSGTRKYRVLHEVCTSGTVLLLAPICLLTWNESLLVFSSSLLFLVLSVLVFFLAGLALDLLR